MKKVLFITDDLIMGYSGGSLGHKKIYDLLCLMRKEENLDFKIISLDSNLPESLMVLNKTRLLDLKSRILLNSSYLKILEKDICLVAREYLPDVIVLGRSRLGFLSIKLKSLMPNTVIVANFDNVEFDYVDSQFADRKGIVGIVLKGIEKILVYFNEKNCIKNSQKYIFLSNRDKNRAVELYKIQTEGKTAIIPVCLDDNIKCLSNNKRKNVVFLGNLQHDSNIQAVLWFLENVWLKYFKDRLDITFTVAGKNAETVLKRYKNIKNLIVYSNFKDVSDVVTEHSLFVAPILNGAGMKVKIAEALSMGLPIIGTEEALVGYEESIHDLKNNGFLYRADNVVDYKLYIDEYISMSQLKLEEIRINNRNAFAKYYTYTRALPVFRNIIQLG